MSTLLVEGRPYTSLKKVGGEKWVSNLTIQESTTWLLATSSALYVATHLICQQPLISTLELIQMKNLLSVIIVA